ncbi:MAG: cell division protein ZapA [Candidatus Kapaibacterium sp.]
MPDSFDVTIGGQNYPLKGENERLVREAAGLVDIHINRIKNRYRDLPAPKLTVLAAVNIAEEYNETKGQADADRDYLKTEINRMADYLGAAIGRNSQ